MSGPRGNPTPMRFIDPLDYEDARQALKASGTILRAAETELDQQIVKSAEAEAEYRRQVSLKMIAFRGERKMGATEAEKLAKGSVEVSAYSEARDIQRDRIKLCHQIIENRRGERASLHKIVDWSMRFANPHGSTPDGPIYGERR